MHIDQPVSLKSEDQFQRYEFAKRIATIVGTPKISKSLIVGLYGKRGEGKTSVMNFIQQELPEEAIVINFNPWFFADEQHLLRSFFSSIAEALGASKKTNKEKIGEFLSDYVGAIGAFTQFVGVNTEGLQNLGDKLKSISIEKFKKRIDDLIIESGQNFVVFVDDIDRLDIEETQYIFKLVKLVADFPRTSYILSFDDEIVSTALAPKYGGNDKAAGYNFLEKIIQVPLKMPKASKSALSKYTLTLLNEVLETNSLNLNENLHGDFLQAFDLAFLPFMDNPRLAIRYTNTFAFSLPLLKGEVNATDLMIIEGIKIFYPELHDFIRSNGHLFLKRASNAHSAYDREQKTKEEIKQRISAAIQLYGENKKKVIVELLERLFPQLQDVYSNTTYPETSYTKWTNEKRICTGRYFSRYFSYAVRKGDIPDNYFEQLISQLETSSIEETVEDLKKTIEQFSAFDLILKLRMNEEVLNEKKSINLASGLARIGDNFPLEQDMHFATTYARSAILISQLVRNVSQPSQIIIVLKLFSEAQSLEYAMEIQYWLMYREKKTSNAGIFSESDERRIEEFLIELFKKELSNSDFFKIISDGNLWRILSWWCKSDKHKDSLKSFLQKNLGDKNNPNFALSLLKIFTPTITASSLGPQDKRSSWSVYKSGFYETNYKALEEVVDTNLLNENLVADYGMHPHEQGPSVIPDRDPIDDKTLVSVFQWFVVNSTSLKS